MVYMGKEKNGGQRTRGGSYTFRRPGFKKAIVTIDHEFSFPDAKKPSSKGAVSDAEEA